jgi:hypothetical protein
MARDGYVNLRFNSGDYVGQMYEGKWRRHRKD